MYKNILSLLLVTPLCCQAISDEQFFNIQRAQRQVNSHTVKTSVAEFDAKTPVPKQKNNGDEKRYNDLRGSFAKSLMHNNTGFINKEAFYSLTRPLSSQKTESFDNILIGQGTFKLVNPQGTFAYSLTSNDGWINAMPPAPAFASAQTAGEMVEDYWSVLVRDVPFNEFGTNATVGDAVDDLNNLSDFRGPKVAGMVTTGTFLRGETPGDLIGPYISQFLYQDVPYGATTLSSDQYRVPNPGTANDFITDFNDWFTTVTGGFTGDAIDFDGTLRFIRNPRDLGEYVHLDFPFQAYLNAALILNSYGSGALDSNLPYNNNPTQVGFVTYGIAQILSMISVTSEEALKSAWFQKWSVNRRVRPEEFGFYLQTQIVGGMNLNIHPDLLNSAALPEIFSTYGSYYLPQAYPEGCPCHPSYPAGHAVISGACVTILKAFFNEDFVIPSPLEPNASNDALVAYGGTLTVGNELNKLASNIAIGRNLAGVHYRSDGYCGILLGEKVAIDILNNCSFLMNENFEGFHLTKFDGKKVIVGRKRSP